MLPAIALLCAALVAALWLGAVRLAGQEEARTVSAVRAYNENLALSHEHQVRRSLQLLDQMLLQLRHRLGSVRAPDLEALVASAGDDAKSILVLSHVDASGSISVAAPASTSREFNYRDRDYFAWHRDRRGDDLFVGVPVLGR
ncbi:MAG: hypothetical protein ACM3ZD_01555, partial [Betaproteobacteria bacterium]